MRTMSLCIFSSCFIVGFVVDLCVKVHFTDFVICFLCFVILTVNIGCSLGNVVRRLYDYFNQIY